MQAHSFYLWSKYQSANSLQRHASFWGSEDLCSGRGLRLWFNLELLINLDLGLHVYIHVQASVWATYFLQLSIFHHVFWKDNFGLILYLDYTIQLFNYKNVKKKWRPFTFNILLLLTFEIYLLFLRKKDIQQA